MSSKKKNDLFDQAFGSKAIRGKDNATDPIDLDATSVDIPSDTYRHVHCRICGKKMAIIFEGHLVLVHNTTKADYIKQFNLKEEDLVAENRRQQLASRKKELELTKINRQLVKLIRQHGVNFTEEFAKTNHQTFYFQAIYHFQTWDKVLQFYKDNQNKKG